MTGNSPASDHHLSMLWEAGGLPYYDISPVLKALYGGGIGFTNPCVYGNLVTSLDGVTALAPKSAPSGRDVAGEVPADRMVMALLRACSDAVIIGAGTMRAHRRGMWSPSSIAPLLAHEWAHLRSHLGRTTDPRLVVVTGRGDLDPAHPALITGASVITTDAGAANLRGRLPAACEVVSVGRHIAISDVLAVATSSGRGVVLTEGGPHLMSRFMAAGLLDELFLTVSPFVAGRIDGDGRLGIVAGEHFLPGAPVRASLLSVRRSGDHLFLRHRFSGGS